MAQAAPSQTLQDLLRKYEAYDKLNWLSKHFLTKLWNFYSNLNVSRAQAIINAIIEGKGNLTGVNLNNFAQQLVSAKVNIPYLITQMEVKGISFRRKDSCKLLIALEEHYVNQAGISNAEQDSRITHILRMPVKFSLTNQRIKNYIKNQQSSPLVISALLKNVHGNAKYGKTIAKLINANRDTPHAAQLAILAYYHLQNYKNWYYRPSIDKPNEIKLYKEDLKFEPDDNIPETTPLLAWMRGYQPLEQRLWNSLNINRLVGSGYEKSIVEYVAKTGATVNEKNNAINYAVSVACKKIHQNTENSIEEVKRALRDNLKVKAGLTYDKKQEIAAEVKKLKTVGEKIEELKKLTASILAAAQEAQPVNPQEVQYKIQLLLKDIVKDIESNSRLRRIFQGAMMNKLKNKEKDAASILLGKDSVQNMATILVSDIDSELLGQITHLMSSTMTDIKDKHNLEPGYLSEISRRYNKVIAYPVWPFFEVLDFFAMLLEHPVEYFTRLLYSAYEYVCRVEDENKRVDKTILYKSDIQTFIVGVTEITKAQSGVQPTLTPAETLRNEIIQYLAGSENRGKLTEAKKAVLDDDKHLSKQLKTAIETIQESKGKYDKKALMNFLDNYEMKGVGSHTEWLTLQTKAIGTIGLIGRAH